MANSRYNTQTTNRRGAMGGGMMKKPMMKVGGDVKKIEKTFKPKNKKKVAKKFKGFSKLPEKVQQKIDAKLAKKV